MKKLIGLPLVVLILLVPSLSCASSGHVAVFYLNGQIATQSMPLSSGYITPSSVKSMVEKINGSGSIKAVVLSIDSPGGEVTASDTILSELNRIDKPLVVSCGSLVASGGYFISMAAGKIVAERTSLVGNIGVIATLTDMSGLMDKLGFKIITYSEGEHKDMYAGTRPPTEEESQIMQVMTDEIYNIFVDVVAEGRGMDKQRVTQLATGQLYTAQQAKDSGLIDEIGDLDKAVEIAAEMGGVPKENVKYYGRGMFSSLFGSAMGFLNGASTLVEVLTGNYHPVMSLEYR